jgi:hypothetical protein
MRQLISRKAAGEHQNCSRHVRIDAILAQKMGHKWVTVNMSVRFRSAAGLRFCPLRVRVDINGPP